MDHFGFDPLPYLEGTKDVKFDEFLTDDAAGKLGAAEEQIVVHEEVWKTRGELVKSIKLRRAEIRILLCYCYLALLTVYYWTASPMIELYFPMSSGTHRMVNIFNLGFTAGCLLYIVFTFADKCFLRCAIKKNDSMAYYEKKDWQSLTLEDLKHWNRKLTIGEILCCGIFLFLTGFEIGMLLTQCVNAVFSDPSAWATLMTSEKFIGITVSMNVTEVVA